MLKLNPDPTFTAPVSIGVPGGEPVKVGFTFKYRDRDELEEFLTSQAGQMSDAEIVMAIASAWEIKEAFTESNVRLLCKKYMSAPRSILDRYVEELTQAREKN